jgi:hypothetical protein
MSRSFSQHLKTYQTLFSAANRHLTIAPGILSFGRHAAVSTRLNPATDS